MGKVQDYYNKFSTSANKIPGVFYIAIIIIIGLCVLFNKFACNKPSHVADNQQNNDEIKWKDSAKRSYDIISKIDSVLIVRLRRQVDSTTARLSITDKLLTKEQAKSLELATNVAIAKKNNDTAKYVSNCDSLSNLTIDLNVKINEARDSVINLLAQKDSLQKATDDRVKKTQDFASGMRSCCDTATAKYSELYKDYKPLLKKANKKFALGIGGGAALGSDAKLGGSVGIYVIRKLISF